VLLAHIDEFEGFLGQGFRCLEYSMRLTQVGKNRTIVVCIRGYIQDFNFWKLPNLFENFIDQSQVNSLANIGLTKKNLFHGFYLTSDWGNRAIVGIQSCKLSAQTVSLQRQARDDGFVF